MMTATTCPAMEASLLEAMTMMTGWFYDQNYEDHAHCSCYCTCPAMEAKALKVASLLEAKEDAVEANLLQSKFSWIG